MTKIDSQIVIAGPPGCGKTTLLKELAQSHLRAGAIVIVQDAYGQFADVLKTYRSAAHYHHAQRELSEQGRAIDAGAAIQTDDSEALTDYVIALADRVRGKVSHVALFYDEAVLVRGLSAHHVPTKMEEIIGTRRHKNLALAILCQDFGQLHPRWQLLATDLYMFRTSSEERIRTCAKRFGLKKEHLSEQLAKLPMRHHYLHIRDESFVSN